MSEETVELAAEGDISFDGSRRRISVKLGDAVLTLTYDEDSEQSATNAAVLIQTAGHSLTALDASFDQELAEGADRRELDGLETEDKDFLLNIIYNPDSDYDDGLEGWPNYDTLASDEHGNRVLEIKFQSDEEPRETMTGRWALVYLGGGKEIKADG